MTPLDRSWPRPTRPFTKSCWRPSITIASLLLLLSACGGDPARATWFSRFKEIHQHANDRHAEAQAYTALAGQAQHPQDRCLALGEAAATLARAEAPAAPAALETVLDDPHCTAQHPRCRYHLARLLARRGEPTRARRILDPLLQADTDSYWARRGLELLVEEPSGFGVEQELPALLVALYEALKETPLAGHCLYHAARAQAREDPHAALYHLVLIIDHHTDSPLWDDALWLAADLLAAAGRPGDETRLLEGALVPLPDRGIDVLSGPFVERVRLRLAAHYERQGRYAEALYQLTLVVNVHTSRSRKDDALWSMARIYGTLGDMQNRQRALQALVEHCPWSRHRSTARALLAPPSQ